ncbi:MAG: phosphatase PAP2 family protein [Jiangellaceae bacterium]
MPSLQFRRRLSVPAPEPVEVTDRAPVRWKPILVEIALLSALFVVYRLGRLLSADRIEQAFDNAQSIYRIQQWVRLPDEAVIQSWLMTWPELIKLANQYYVVVHFPVTLAFLVWGYLRRPLAEYHWARALLVAQTAMALVLHVAVPLAPPRMFPELGFVDTMTTIGPSAYGGSVAAVANQYAAMPSLHVGWALLIGVVVWRTATGPIRWIVVAHATLTMLVVVVTANHWWVDGLVAAALLGISLAIHPRPRPARGASPAGIGSPVQESRAGQAP